MSHSILEADRFRSFAILALFVFIFLLLQSTSLAAGRVHLVVIADTEATAGGSQFEEAAVDFQSSIEPQLVPGDGTPSPVNVVRLFGGDCKRAKIKEALGGLSVGEDDAVVVYLGAHGFLFQGGNDLSRQFYALSKDGEPNAAETYLTRPDLEQWVKQIDCRLRVLMTDSCAPRSFAVYSTESVVDVFYPNAPTPLARSLYLESRGFLSLNSCGPKEFALLTSSEQAEPGTMNRLKPGSVFTEQLLSLADEKNEVAMDWTGFLDKLKGRVASRFDALEPDGRIFVGNDIRDQDTQTVTISVSEELGRISPEEHPFDRLGLVLAESQSGIVVGKVLPGSVASRCGIKANYTIRKINGRPVFNLRDYDAVLSTIGRGGCICITFCRF